MEIKEILLCQTLAIVIGYVLDLLFGDPVYWFHPIRLIGTFIMKVEAWLRNFEMKNKQVNKWMFRRGVCLWIIVVVVSTAVPAFILYMSYSVSIWLGLVIESIFCYQLLATKGLKTESMRVYHSLKKEDIKEARHNVSMIVGRDTKWLTEEGITKATVETIAENASDGVVAPLLYMMLGGATLGFFYKAINTLDSMVGYKNDKYLYFGRCSAKMDDVANYLPARIAGYLIVVASPLVKLDAKNAFRIFRRDARKHASPNSAQTESACAGALHVRLAGDAFYFGKLVKKPYIGDEDRKIEVEDIKRTNRLLYATSLVTILVVVLVRVVLW